MVGVWVGGGGGRGEEVGGGGGGGGGVKNVSKIDDVICGQPLPGFPVL